MGKAARLRDQSARERIAAQQALARRAERRRRVIIAGGSITVVIALVVALLVAHAVKSSSKPVASTSHAVLPASVTANIMTVPGATLNKVAAGSVPSYANNAYLPPAVVPISDKPLTSGGRPEMLYIGAEFCPFCAAMRWSMAVSLSRFGHFTTPLRGIHSSPTDTDPNTPTLTFYKTSYTSSYLTFTPVENEDINHKTLQPTTSAQQALWQKYDSTSQGVGYPFIDFGNKAIIKAPLFDPALLKGLNWAQVAMDMRNPSSPVAQAILGTANYMTAAICKMTGNQPSTVCSSTSITNLEAGL